MPYRLPSNETAYAHEMTQIQNKQLFREFPAVGTAEWKAKAIAELKETPYERIVWQTPDGFPLEPWHAQSRTLPAASLQGGGLSSNWRSCRLIAVSDPFEANREALGSFSQDVAALEFSFMRADLSTPEALAVLLKGISIPAVAIYFSGYIDDPHGLMEILAGIPDFAENTGGLLWRPAEPSLEHDTALFRNGEAMSSFRFLAVDTIPWHEQGATPSQEIALALAQTSDLLHHFTGSGILPEQIISAMEVVMATGSSHFAELAKPRALRALLRHICLAYGYEGSALSRLFARTSRRNRSVLDPFTNVLRQTTEAVSAVLGGYETLQIDPFDNGLSVPKDDAERISGNIHLILRGEAFLGRVADPASGSHYIEAMTSGLAESAWKFFLAIESEGGLGAARRSGMIDAAIAESAEARKKSVEHRKKSLVGVNRFPWPLTLRQDENILALQDEAGRQAKGNETREFELLRLKAESHRIRTGRIPSVFIWMSGDPSVSFRQAAFSEDFFSCGGFGICGTGALEMNPEGFAEALRQNPDIVVLCIAEKDPVPPAETICCGIRALQPGVMTVMAGKPPAESDTLYAAGLDSFIHTGINVLEMLQSYHHKTGIQ
jgi:methylmalonyl-CoA mutase